MANKALLAAKFGTQRKTYRGARHYVKRISNFGWIPSSRVTATERLGLNLKWQ